MKLIQHPHDKSSIYIYYDMLRTYVLKDKRDNLNHIWLDQKTCLKNDPRAK